MRYEILETAHPWLEPLHNLELYSTYGSPEPTGRTATKGKKTYREFKFTRRWFIFWTKVTYAFILDGYWRVAEEFVIHEQIDIGDIIG